MSRKVRTPDEQARRAKIRELLQESNINSMEDIQNLFRDTIAEFMGNGLETELDESLGYSKYDYKNKDTDNNRTGYSKKNLRTSFGDVEISVPVTVRGNLSLSSSKRIRPVSAKTLKKRYFEAVPNSV